MSFKGFPECKSRQILLPESFFHELLTAIDHLGELKLTLYFFWRLNRMEGQFRYLTRADFVKDSRFMLGMSANPQGAEPALDLALKRAVDRGTLLKAEIGGAQHPRAPSAEQHQIVVHVNDGSDGSLDWVRAEGLDHTASGTNIGICYAMNEATMLARHEHLVYMNDDMYCLPGWDTALQRRAATMPSDLYLLSGTMVEPRDSGNPCVVVGPYGDGVESFREADLLRDAPRLVRADWYAPPGRPRW